MSLRPTSGMGLLRKSASGDYLLTIPGRRSGGPPVITTQPVGGTFAVPHAFTVVATGASPLSYQWQINSGTWSDITDDATYSGSQTASLTVSAPVLATIRCVVSNPFGEVASDQIDISTTP